MYRKSEKIIARLEALASFDEFQMNTLHNLAYSKNSTVRRRTAVLLGRQYDSKSEDILYHLTFDKNEIVQLEAIDSLSIGKTIKSMQRLVMLLKSNDYYIRYFAVQSLYDIYRNSGFDSENKDLDFLVKIRCELEKEENDLVRIALYKVAYLCGENEALAAIIRILIRAIEECNHSLISPALNILDEILEEPSSMLGTEISPFLDKLDKQQYELVLTMI